jgi:hypothetical protein
MSLLGSTRSRLAVAVVAITSLAVPAAAQASGPVISENNDTTPQTIIEWGDCPTYTIDATYMANRRNEDFYDSNGNLVLERRHISFTGVLYNDSDPSRSLPYEGTFTLTIDFAAGTVKNSGFGHVIVPGEGVIWLNAGLFFAGADFAIQHGPSGDLTQLCAALT